jgi:hypothetical protein
VTSMANKGLWEYFVLIRGVTRAANILDCTVFTALLHNEFLHAE